MKTTETHGRHLTPDEIVERVFPVGERSAPVPLHLAVCADCQSKVARLREGWLLDRGAVAGAVEALPETFWEVQTGAVMESVKDTAPEASIHPFPFSIQRSFLRRPILAFGSMAAALALVAGMALMRPSGTASDPIAKTTKTTPVAQPQDQKDDELLRSVDQLLSEETPYSTLAPEGIS